MKLYLVRHGETALNEKGCYYGKTDAVLSVRGIEQAIRHEITQLLIVVG